MKRTAVISLAVAAILAAGGLFAWLNTRPAGPRAMVLKVSGPTGLKVSAALIADGRSRSEEKALPREFTATARPLHFRVGKLGGGDEPIRVEVYADGVMQGTATSLREVTGQLEFEGRDVKQNSISG